MDDAWKADFDEPRPLLPRIYEWCSVSTMIAVNTYWVSKYTTGRSISGSNWMRWGTDPWLAFLIIQLVGVAYSWVACNFLFPKMPCPLRIPFLFIGFGPAFLIFAIPFMTGFGMEFAFNAPFYVFQLWSLVRFCIESTIQLHAKCGVKGISYWLRTPFQKVEESYTMTYPFTNFTVTRTHGGNIDAVGSVLIGLPTAIIFAVVDNDTSTGIQAVAWITQIWFFIYLNVGPFLHFAMGMPGPKNIFDGKTTPIECTRMDALTTGRLGVVAYMAGSYAVIHFFTFLMKTCSSYPIKPSNL
jgi:hypothetical protein